MGTLYRVRISEKVYTQLHEISKENKLSMKDYTESSIQFFSSRNLNPKKFELGKEYDITREVRKSVDRVLGFIITQEKGILKNILNELVRGRLLSEILINNLHNLSDLKKGELEALQNQNKIYLSEKMKVMMEDYEQVKKKRNED